MRFSDLHLMPALQQAVSEQGYEKPTPIQSRAIPPGLEGRDVLGIAQTGTGKTAAFSLPILHQLAQHPDASTGRRHTRVLVLAPTRELAAQIAESFRDYGRHLHLKCAVVYGGVGQRPQEDEIRRGIDILVACPGRLLDLMNQGIVNLGSVEHLVLDEADRMLDMGFLPDIRRIVSKVPKDRQTMFFSATMPDEIASLAADMLRDPVSVQVTPVASAAETVDQAILRTTKEEKVGQLEPLVRATQGRVLVFTRTKHGADRVVRKLSRSNLSAAAIHGDKSQGARTKALEGFRDGSIPVLVASDIAARGLDIDEIRLVVNYDIPGDADTYVHRIGRTGRAGATGRAITFVTPDDAEALRDIVKRIGRNIPDMDGTTHPIAEVSSNAGAPSAPAPRGEKAPRRRNRGRNGKPGPSDSGKASGERRRESGQASGRSSDRSRSASGSEKPQKSGQRRPGGRGRTDERSSQQGGRREEARRSSEKSSPRGSEPRTTASGKPLPKLSQPSEGGLVGRIWRKFTGL